MGHPSLAEPPLIPAPPTGKEQGCFELCIPQYATDSELHIRGTLDPTAHGHPVWAPALSPPSDPFRGSLSQLLLWPSGCGTQPPTNLHFVADPPPPTVPPPRASWLFLS